MSQSFRALGVSAAVAARARRPRNHRRSRSRASSSRTHSPGSTSSPQSPTGSGKTLAFGLPLIERTAGRRGGPGALVLVPTRELAAQVVEDLAPLAAASGCASRPSTAARPSRAGEAGARAEILVATPGRLHDLIERRLVSLAGVRILVLDEADRMLDMGFRPQVDRILDGVPANRQTMLFSATLDGAVADLAQRLHGRTPSHIRAAAPSEAERRRRSTTRSAR